MMRRIGRAYVVEMQKALRQKYTYLGPGLLALLVACLPLVHPITKDHHSDYEFIAYATGLSLNLAGLLLLLTFCAGLISSDLGSGVIRMVLVRPLLRSEYLAAKLLLGLTYGFCLTLVVAASSWALVFARGELLGVSYGGELRITSRHMLGAYVFGMMTYLLPQGAAAAYAVMISAMTRRTGAAIGAAVGVWVVLDAVKYPLGIAPILFTSYLESPWQVFNDGAQGIETGWVETLQFTAPASLAAIVVFSLAAWLILRRKNLYL
jgi:ABC-type transport system involved in multi-copper enzyme maturation permease subunit